MLSFHRREKQQHRSERDAIFRWLKDNCVPNDGSDMGDDGVDEQDDPILHICFMDGGRAAMRTSLYPELLGLVHTEGAKHGEKGLKYYFVERLPDSRIARLYIDLDLYVANEALVPSEATMQMVTRVVQRAARDAWRLETDPAFAVASAKPRAEERFIGKTTRKLKRMDTTAADLESFFAHEEYEKTTVYKVGVHWIFPSIVDHSERLQAFAHHLKSVLNREVDPMKLFGVVAGWNDAVDLGIYKGDGRGAFRLPYCHKAKACPEKAAFRFDAKVGQYVATEGNGSRPPTMQCGKAAPPYQGRDAQLAKKYNSGFRGRVVQQDRRLPDETDVRKFPEFVGKGRAKKLLKEGVETVTVHDRKLSVRCVKCLNEGYVSMATFYVPCDWSELKLPTDFSIVPLGQMDGRPLQSFRTELVGPMTSFIEQTQTKAGLKRRRRAATDMKRALKTTTRSDRLAIAESMAMPPDVSALFVKMMEAVTFKKRGVPYQPFKDTARDMELTATVHYRQGVGEQRLIEALHRNQDPPVRVWVYDETSFCPMRFARNGQSNCHHSSNRSYVEVSCMGFRAQCLDTDDAFCYPGGKKPKLMWRKNEYSQPFWDAFVTAGLRGPLSTTRIRFSILQVERVGLQQQAKLLRKLKAEREARRPKRT